MLLTFLPATDTKDEKVSEGQQRELSRVQSQILTVRGCMELGRVSECAYLFHGFAIGEPLTLLTQTSPRLRKL